MAHLPLAGARIALSQVTGLGNNILSFLHHRPELLPGHRIVAGMEGIPGYTRNLLCRAGRCTDGHGRGCP